MSRNFEWPHVDTHLILFSNPAVLELTLEPLPTNSEWAIAPTLRGPGSRFDRLKGGCWTLGIWQQKSLTCFTWKSASGRFRIWFNHHCIIIISFLQYLFGGKCTTTKPPHLLIIPSPLDPFKSHRRIHGRLVYLLTWKPYKSTIHVGKSISSM